MILYGEEEKGQGEAEAQEADVLSERGGEGLRPSPPLRHAIVGFGRAMPPLDWAARRLKPKFQHCFAVVRTEIAWIAVDPMRHWTFVDWVARWETPPNAICARLNGSGCSASVYLQYPQPARRWTRPLPYTCVEEVKRVIGLRSWALTPWQLYRDLWRHPGAILRWGPDPYERERLAGNSVDSAASDTGRAD